MKKILTFFFLLIFPFQALADSKGWDLLREGNKVILIRHALADQLPDGTRISGGDAPGFTLDSCAKQRVLGKAGIEQSKKIGILFKENKIKIGEVKSSIWCRCQQTAKYAFGNYEILPALNSTFQSQYSHLEPKQLNDLKNYVKKWNSNNKNLILVTHFSIITAITNSSPGQGSIVVTDKNFKVLSVINP